VAKNCHVILNDRVTTSTHYLSLLEKMCIVYAYMRCYKRASSYEQALKHTFDE